MRIAVTYDSGEIFQHFGDTEYFKFYEVEGKEVVSSEIVSAEGYDHLKLVEFLKERAVNTLICGHICGQPRYLLAEARIAVYPGVMVDADTAVDAYLNGVLMYDNGCYDHNERCDHCNHC